MNRRTFLKASSLVSCFHYLNRLTRAEALHGDFISPMPLRPGDIVGVIAPGLRRTDKEYITATERVLKSFGYRIRFGANINKQWRGYDNSVTERLNDLHSMFRDPQVRGVFALPGGYGSAHLLDRIDYDLLRKNPKAFIGYGDNTALHVAIHKHAKLATFHGGADALSFQELDRETGSGSMPVGTVHEDESSRSNWSRPIRSGLATGPLIGGNLTVISSLMGTPHEIDTKGRILFLEDVGEEPYRIDRMLTQLKLAGKFDAVSGVIFDGCANGG